MAIHFKQAFAFGTADVNWLESEQIAVKIHIETEGVAHDLSLNWQIAATELDSLFKIVTALNLSVPNLGSQYVFQQTVSSIPTQVSWNDARETTDLKLLREEVARISHLSYAIALASLRLGQKLHNNERLKSSISAYRFGIATLGDRYSNPDLLDDTPTKLGLAQFNLRSDKLSEAAVLFERVLESRTEVYKTNHPYLLQPS